MKFRMLIAVTVFFAFGTFGYAQKMVVDFDHTADFKSFKTFGFSKGQIAPKPATSQLVISAIERELTSRGLVRNDEEHDITVTVLAAAGVDLQGVGPTWNNEIYRSWGGYGNPAALMTVTTGNLLVDLIVKSTNHGLFRGVARDIFLVPLSGNPEKDFRQMESTVNKTVKKMFKKYPVKQGN